MLDKGSCQAAAEKTEAELGRIEVLVNGAGGNKREATTSDDLAFFDLPAEAVRFDDEFTRRHRAPDRTLDVHHVRLDLQVDLDAQRIAGEAALRLSPLAVATDRLDLHAVELEVEADHLATSIQ